MCERAWQKWGKEKRLSMEAVLLKGKAAKHIKKGTTGHIRIPVFSKNKIKNVSCTSCLAFPFKNTCMYIFIPYNMYDEEWNCSRLRFNPARGKRWQMDFIFLSYRGPLTKLRAFFFGWGGGGCVQKGKETRYHN